jgi:bacterioferritin
MSAHLIYSGPDATYPFLSNVAEIRQRARRHIQQCAATSDPTATTQTILRVLNEALAIELGRWCRSRKHMSMVTGTVSAAVEAELLRHSHEEQRHVGRIAARIVQLGGNPSFLFHGTADLWHTEYIEGESLADMIEEDLIAERIVVESYSEIIHYLSERDPLTRRLFESILAVAEQHVAGLASRREHLLGKNRAGGARRCIAFGTAAGAG